MSPRLRVFCVLAAAAVAAVQGRSAGPQPEGNVLPETRAKPEVTGYLADFRLLVKLYDECSAGELSTCLKKKIVMALDRIGRTAKKLTLLEGVQVVKDLSVPDPRPLTEEELDTSLPRSLEDKDYALNQLIFDKIIHFFTSHTVEFKIIEDQDRSLEEGRRRKGYHHTLFMYPLLLGGTFIPLAFGALALLAGKALIVSKLALALAAIVGLKKLVGGGGESYQVVQVPHHGGGHYKRSLEDSEAQELVYRGYLTAPTDKPKGV